MEEESAYAGQLLAGFVYLVVAFRLGKLAARTRKVPERLLTLAFLFGGLSYIVYVAAPALGIESLAVPLTFAGRVIYIPTAIALSMFTRRVFRPRSRWATGLVYATAILILGGVGGSALEGDWLGYSLEQPWVWFEWTAWTLPSVWNGAEASVQYRKARRRLKLGLCGPVGCNRLLLWSLYGVAGVGASIGLLGQFNVFGSDLVSLATWDLIVGSLEIASLLAILLAFAPPRFYLQWLSGPQVLSSENVDG